MSNLEKSDDFIGLGVKGVESAGIESAGFGYGGIGGRPSMPPPSLDLQFAADRRLTARKGPTPAYTRSGNAAYHAPQLQVQGYLLNTIYQSIAVGYPTFTVSYNGSEWQIIKENDPESQDIFYAAAGNEVTPDLADWSQSGSTPVTATSSFLVYNAGTNKARFDYDPITLESEGLLIEGPKTNLCKGSQAVGSTANGAWNNDGNLQIQLNTAVSPDSSTNASRIYPTNGVDSSFYGSTPILTATGFYTFSFYAKSSNSNSFNIPIQVGGLNLGQIALEAFASITTQWKRYSFTLEVNDLDNYYYAFGNPNDIPAEDWTHPILLWGAQFEAGDLSSLIRTTTSATAVRNADVCSISGSNFASFYSTTGATYLCDFAGGPLSETSPSGILSVKDDSSNASNINFFSDYIEFHDFAFGSVASFSPVRVPYVFKKVAVSENPVTNKTSISYGGGTAQVGDDISNATFVPTTMLIGFGNDFVGSGYLNGHIKSLTFYKKALSGSKIKSLTA